MVMRYAGESLIFMPRLLPPDSLEFQPVSQNFGPPPPPGENRSHNVNRLENCVSMWYNYYSLKITN